MAHRNRQRIMAAAQDHHRGVDNVPQDGSNGYGSRSTVAPTLAQALPQRSSLAVLAPGGIGIEFVLAFHKRGWGGFLTCMLLI